MICAILSLVLGILSFVGPVPVVVPIIGLALGANAIIKESKKANKTKSIIGMSVAAIAANGFVSTMFVLKIFLS